MGDDCSPCRVTDRVRACARRPLAQAAPDAPRRADCQGAPRLPVPRHPRHRARPAGLRHGAGRPDRGKARFCRRARRVRGHERVDLRRGIRDLIPSSRPGDPRRRAGGQGCSARRTSQEACSASGRSCRLARRALRQPQAAVGSGERRVVGRRRGSRRTGTRTSTRRSSTRTGRRTARSASAGRKSDARTGIDGGGSTATMSQGQSRRHGSHSS